MSMAPMSRMRSEDSRSSPHSFGMEMMDVFLDDPMGVSLASGSQYSDGAVSSIVVDRPGTTIRTMAGTKPTLVTRISGRFGADGDLDGDDLLTEYELASVEVDVDEDGIRSTCARMLCVREKRTSKRDAFLNCVHDYHRVRMCTHVQVAARRSHSSTLFMQWSSMVCNSWPICSVMHWHCCLQVLHRYLCSFRDLAAREGLLEPLDALQWTSSLVCTPGQALDGDAPVLLQSPTSAHATGTGTAMHDSPASLADLASPLAGAHESKLLEDNDDEDDDGVPAEMDAVIYDGPPAMELNELSTDSGMKPVAALKSHMSHHVLFSAASSSASEPESQISVAPDWFSSLGVGEPPFTTWTPKLQGCVDYIWFTPVRFLKTCFLLLLPFI